jgi:predicted ATPase
MAILDETQEALEGTRFRLLEEELHRIWGELLLMREPPDEQRAETEFLRAIEVARDRQAKSLELRAKVNLGRL